MFVLAFRALPLVLVISALSALLFYWRVLPAIVRAISFVLERAMRVGGVVGKRAAWPPSRARCCFFTAAS